jgi:hypothetical protein
MHVMDRDLRALDNEPKTAPITPTLRDQLPILVIKEEEPLKLLTRGRAIETALSS